MIAQDVFNIAKALSNDEQKKLFALLSEHITPTPKTTIKTKSLNKIITEQEALKCLIELFNNNNRTNRTKN